MATRTRESISPQPTFRDPSGTLLVESDRVVRYLTDEGHANLQEFLASDFAKRIIQSGELIDTISIADASIPDPPQVDQHRNFSCAVSHPRVPFITYPSEWSPQQLYDAASLTLDLATQALEQGFLLKDATPYNVLFRGSSPVFVDVPSFVSRNPGTSAWPAGGQFSRMFLLPLLAYKLGIPNVSALFLTNRDGIDASTLAELPFITKFFHRGYFSLVAMPTFLSRISKAGSIEPSWEPKAGSDEKAIYTLQWILKSFRRQLRAVQPKPHKNTHWANYQRCVPSYSASEFAIKNQFVADVITELKPKRVLDIGCNEGLFSKVAADNGAAVVSFDQDPGVIDALYKESRASGRNILPLVLDLGRPTPPHGWRNGECISFLDRARGHSDFVMALAILHHLLVTEGVPLVDALGLLAELTTRHLLIEYVDPQDPHFQNLLHGRDNIHRYLTREHFEEVASRHFGIVRALDVKPGLRTLYLMVRNG